MFKLISQKKTQLLIISVLIFAVYSNTLGNEFTADEVGYIQNWETPKHVANIGKILTYESVPPDEAGVYRPIKSLFIMFSWHIWGNKPFGYHLDGILLHILNTVLVYLIAAQLVHEFKRIKNKSERIHNIRTNSFPISSYSYVPFLTSLLFGLHPIQTEAITLLTSSFDSLGWTFYLGSVAAYLKGKSGGIKGNRGISRWYLASLVLAGLAFFTYELTLSLPFALILIHYIFARGPVSSFLSASARSRVNSKGDERLFGLLRAVGIPSRIATPRVQSNVSGQLSVVRYLPYFAILAIYLFVRFILIGAGTRGSYLGDSFYKTQLVMTFAYVEYLKVLIWPVNLTIDHKLLPGIYSVVYKAFVSQETLDSLTLFSPRVLLNLGILGGLGGLGVLLFAHPRGVTWRLVGFSIFWFFVALSPAGFLLPQSTIMAERYAYLAAFGFTLIIADLLLMCADRGGKSVNLIVWLLVVTITLGYGVRTFVRNFDYHDTLTFWQKLTDQSPDNVVSNYTLAKIYAEQGNDEKAISYFDRALSIQPGIVEVNYRLGRIFQKRGQLDEAKNGYKMALNSGNKYSSFAKWNLERLERLSAFCHSRESGNLDPRVREDDRYCEGNVQKESWATYQLGSVSFEYPAWWLVTRGKNTVIFDDPANPFSVQITTFDLPFGQQLEKFAEGHQEAGTLVRLTEAKIDNFDRGIAKFFKDDDVERLEFFLLGGSKVVHIWIYPLNSSSIKEFDRMLGTLNANGMQM